MQCKIQTFYFLFLIWDNYLVSTNQKLNKEEWANLTPFDNSKNHETKDVENKSKTIEVFRCQILDQYITPVQKNTFANSDFA